MSGLYHFLYTSVWFERIIANLEHDSIPLEKSQFAMILMNKMNHKIIEFLNSYYSDLDKESGHALQIFAPTRPPWEEYLIKGPLFPLENRVELIAFNQSLKEGGISLKDLPKIVLFSINKMDEENYYFSYNKVISLKEIENGRSMSYEEFFSGLIELANESYIKGDFNHEEFAYNVAFRYKSMIIEEKIKSLPVIGNLYKKYVKS